MKQETKPSFSTIDERIQYNCFHCKHLEKITKNCLWCNAEHHFTDLLSYCPSFKLPYGGDNDE